MLAINTQLSGLIMWNCGKFTWGSGTNDIRVWPCFSEMAPAPAAGTRRLPKKIWSHFVLLDASPPPTQPLPLAHFLPFLTAATLPPLFQSLCLSSHFHPQICKSSSSAPPFLFFFLFLLHLLLLAKESPITTGRTNANLNASCIISSLTTCVTPEQ